MRARSVTQKIGDVEVTEREEWESLADEARDDLAQAQASGRIVVGETQNGVSGPPTSLLDAVYGAIPSREHVSDLIDAIGLAQVNASVRLSSLGEYMGTAVASPLREELDTLYRWVDQIKLDYDGVTERVRRQEVRIETLTRTSDVMDRLLSKANDDLTLTQERLSEAECAALGALAETASLKASITSWVKHRMVSDRGWALVEKRAKRARKPYDDEAEAIVGNRRARAARASGRA